MKREELICTHCMHCEETHRDHQYMYDVISDSYLPSRSISCMIKAMANSHKSVENRLEILNKALKGIN